MNKYEARQQARRDRLEARADRARSASNMIYSRAEVMASAIPSGQPILRGHHSERRDRNYRARIHNAFGKTRPEQIRVARTKHWGPTSTASTVAGFLGTKIGWRQAGTGGHAFLR